MFNILINKIHEYQAKGIRFAVVQVIDKKAPSSSKVSDKAIVLENGQLIGWIGGGCVKGIVIHEALKVLQTNKYRRIRIAPSKTKNNSENLIHYTMSCYSEGAVEVLIEPFDSLPEIIVVGKSNIAMKLVEIAAVANFKVTVIAKDPATNQFPTADLIHPELDFKSLKNPQNAYIIIASQGDNDEEKIVKALETSINYVGLISSAKKAKKIRAFLATTQLSPKRIAELRSPVGIDINAKQASEVAISILADIIQHFRNTTPNSCCNTKTKTPQEEHSKAFSEEFYINPVCNVPVSKITPKHILEYGGKKVFFCCDGCKISFEKNPELYLPSKQ